MSVEDVALWASAAMACFVVIEFGWLIARGIVERRRLRALHSQFNSKETP